MTCKPAGVVSSMVDQEQLQQQRGPDCVEVAATPSTIHVRDSKDTTVPHLTISPTVWTDFLTHTTS